MLPGMGEMNENYDSPSRIAKGLSVAMAGALSTALESGRYAASHVRGRTNTLAGLVARGLITPGRVHYLTDLGRRVMYAGGMDVALLDDLHAEAAAEDRERHDWGPIPAPKPDAPAGDWTHLDDRGRHVLTGVEVVTLTSVSDVTFCEVRMPRWINGCKLMETVYAGDSFSAPNWALKVAIPDALYRLRGDHEYALRIDAQRNARRNRVQRVHLGDGRVIEEVKKLIPEGWAPEHSAKLAAEARPGSLAEAAAIVDGVVKAAQLAALRAVLAEIDAWWAQGSSLSPEVRQRGLIAAEAYREMLATAADKLGVELP